MGSQGEEKPDIKANEKDTITIRVREMSGEETLFKVKRTTQMKKVFNAFAARKGVDSHLLRFMLDGSRIGENDTPKTLDLEEDDQIDCMYEQQGGQN